jgi:hypothetical protein
MTKLEMLELVQVMLLKEQNKCSNVYSTKSQKLSKTRKMIEGMIEEEMK